MVCSNVSGMRANTLKVHAPRPVPTPALHFKKILAPVDFSEASKNGFNYAVRCAEQFGAELTLLYVLEPVPSATFVAPVLSTAQPAEIAQICAGIVFGSTLSIW